MRINLLFNFYLAPFLLKFQIFLKQNMFFISHFFEKFSWLVTYRGKIECCKGLVARNKKMPSLKRQRRMKPNSSSQKVIHQNDPTSEPSLCFSVKCHHSNLLWWSLSSQILICVSLGVSRFGGLPQKERFYRLSGDRRQYRRIFFRCFGISKDSIYLTSKCMKREEVKVSYWKQAIRNAILQKRSSFYCCCNKYRTRDIKSIL